MTDMVRVRVCAQCGEDVRHWAECPRCGNKNFDFVDISYRNVATRKTILTYIENTISKANGFIVSRYPCFFCDKTHYMIWPGLRDSEDYTKVRSLTTLPQCPVRVWNLARGIKVPLGEFLEGLKV